jgi:hypothetical protein
MGVLRLGQPLKSFRDRNIQFDIYQRGAQLPYLNSLGKLHKPTRLEQITEVLQTNVEEPTVLQNWMNKLKI